MHPARGRKNRETATITPSVPEGESWKFYYYAGSARIAMRLKNLYGEQVYYFFSDHLGSTNVITDPNGNVVSETLYKAWGEIRYSSGSSPTDFSYTGQRSEMDDIGLMFYNARWYSPELGRFTQPDTIVPGAGSPAAYDRYAYVVNNPIDLIDPSGHDVGCSAADPNCWSQNAISLQKIVAEQLQVNITSKNNQNILTQFSFQLIPIFEPFYYSHSAEETFSGFSGSGDPDFLPTQQWDTNQTYQTQPMGWAVLIGLFADFLHGIRPNYLQSTSPYDQILTIFYNTSFQGIPRLDAQKTTTISNISITNNSSINQVINYTVGISGSNQFIEAMASAGPGETAWLAFSPFDLGSGGIEISINAFTGCTNSCIYRKEAIEYRGFLKRQISQ